MTNKLKAMRDEIVTKASSRDFQNWKSKTIKTQNPTMMPATYEDGIAYGFDACAALLLPEIENLKDQLYITAECGNCSGCRDWARKVLTALDEALGKE